MTGEFQSSSFKLVGLAIVWHPEASGGNREIAPSSFEVSSRDGPQLLTGNQAIVPALSSVTGPDRQCSGSNFSLRPFLPSFAVDLSYDE